MTRRMLVKDARGGWAWGRPRLGRMDRTVALGSRGLTVETTWQCPKDRNEQRALVHMLMIVFITTDFAQPCVLLDHTPGSGGLSHGEGWDPIT